MYVMLDRMAKYYSYMCIEKRNIHKRPILETLHREYSCILLSIEHVERFKGTTVNTLARLAKNTIDKVVVNTS